jgi:phage terminase small subunit
MTMPRRKSTKKKLPPESKPLTPAEVVFVDEYLIDLNATQAYRRAFPGCTYWTAATEGCRFLKKPNIRREVQAAKKARAQRTGITADRVLKELARIAFSDVFDLFDADGKVAPARNIPLDSRRAISGVKVRKEKTATRTNGRTTVTESECEVEYKFWPKTEALKSLCNHLGLTTEITPLDALLAGLPPRLAEEIRQAIAGTVPGGSPAKGAPTKRPG